MPYTKSEQHKFATESVGTSSASRRSSTTEMLPGSPIRKSSVSGQLDALNRRISSAQALSPVVAPMPNANSRRSTVLADLDSASPISLSSANFYSRQRAVKEALVQSIVRRQERNRDNGNSLFLFPSNRSYHDDAASSTKDSFQHEDQSSTNELGESIADFVKLGVQVSSSWLREELKISPAANKRFEIFRNPTPEFLDDPTTPKLGVHLLIVGSVMQKEVFW